MSAYHKDTQIFPLNLQGAYLGAMRFRQAHLPLFRRDIHLLLLTDSYMLIPLDHLEPWYLCLGHTPIPVSLWAPLDEEQV